jgi:SagB-type dehydrogenase family enzyme
VDYPEGAATIALWSLTEDTLVEIGEDGSLVVLAAWGELEVGDADALIVESLRRMALGPVSLRNVTSSPDSSRSGQDPGPWCPDADPADLGSLRRVLAELSGSVVRSLGQRDGKRPLLSVIPVGFAPELAVRPVPAGRAVRLSRFAALRRGAGGLLLESPSAPFRVLLSRAPAARIASVLYSPATIAEVAAETEVAEAVVADVVAYLVAAGAVLVGDGNAEFAEDNDPELRRWSHHDLLFHVRSRTRLTRGRYEVLPGGPVGAQSAPVVKPVPGGPSFPLYRPDPALVADTALTGVLETDHHCPVFDGRELSARQLGELLYRGARIRSVNELALSPGYRYEASQRPYFSIARLYELELYLGLDRCDGLAKGIYHYDPQGHGLTLVNDDADELDAMLDTAMVAGKGRRRPVALITVTARLARTSWALGGSAYSTALLHVGALQQTLYLTAKAMGLAAHAVPLDAGDRVDRALKLRWPHEVALGECVLGLVPEP